MVAQSARRAPREVQGDDRAPFEYEAPATVEDAVRLLSELGDRGRVLAGATA